MGRENYRARSEVPAWAKEGLTAKESDVTERYEEKLELTVAG